MTHRKKPGSPEDIVSHHGVKGMKWGVRNEDDLVGEKVAPTKTAETNASIKSYMAAADKLNRETKPSEKTYQENRKKFLAKFGVNEPSGGKVSEIKPGEKKKLTPEQKKLIAAAGLTAVTAGALFYAYKTGHLGGGGPPPAVKAVLAGKDISGKHLTYEEYKMLTAMSKGKAWTGGHVQPSSFLREGFTIPAGETFHRLSTQVETDFSISAFGKTIEGISKPTYATHSIEDFNRYIAGFSGEKAGLPLNHITWKSTAPVKVPALHEVMDSLREVIIAENPKLYKQKPLTDEGVLAHYAGISGSDWLGDRSLALVSNLKKKGFGAVIDEMDAGVIGESPIVFFSDKVTPKTSKPLSGGVMETALENLTEMKNRKL